MDFKDQFKLFKDEEEKLLKLKNGLKKEALIFVKELIEQFNFSASDLFSVKKAQADKLDWSGFEVGKVYKDGGNVYTFKKQGRKPSWLTFLVKNGTKAEDLLKVDVVSGKATQPTKATQPAKKA